MPEPRICPACGDATHRFLEASGEYNILECSNCRLSFSDPMRAGSGSYYEDHVVYHGANEATARMHFRSADNKNNRALLASLKPGSHMLDIGCGYGAFVALAVRHHHDAWGIDFNRSEIEIGSRVYNLPGRLQAGQVQEVPQLYDLAAYDLVTMFEVIEHVESPRTLLSVAFDLLKPGGMLVLSCPNEDRWQPTGRVFADYPPHHLTRWRPRTLAQLLGRIGYTDIRSSVDTSLADLFWTYCVNRSAAKRSTAILSGEHKAVARGDGRNWKHLAFDAAKVLSAPANLCLHALKVGTMGMRTFAIKPRREPHERN